MSNPNSHDKRMARYTASIQVFAARTMLLHQKIAEEIGLNATDFRCYRLLSVQGIETAAQLAAETGLTPAALTIIVDRLVNSGFVRRQAAPNDRRKTILIQDEKKQKIVAASFKSHSKAMRELLGQYTDDEFELLMGFMEGISAIIAHEK